MVTIWEISRSGFKDSGRQIGEKLFALLSPCQKKELAQFVRDYDAGNIPADVPILYTSSRPVFYPAAGRSAIDGNPGRCFIFLLRAAPCYCTESDNSANGQGI